MVKIQLDLSEKINKDLKHFMIDQEFYDKRIAVHRILEFFFSRFKVKDKHIKVNLNRK
jgi:hypothetical protein